ncbi:DEAD/DEAH box helicase [Deferribacteraceae bacterium V6Fe1]|nr:DEAD/DEAH box helicase [Deferribacteraceae bacterium V6Fe1]
MNNFGLVPCKMCCVKLIHKPENGFGFVLKVEVDKEEISFQVFFPKLNQKVWLKPTDLSCGFSIGMVVKNIPSVITRKSLGVGKVLRIRKIEDIEQVLVDFFDSGKKVWLPYQVLAFTRDIDEKFYNQVLEDKDNTKYFAIRNLAYALELWHQNTGGLSHLDIEPLPHQIHLVHHILNSGNYNWLIADDVGLGKTIEVGLLISALMAREIVHRVLVVTPASLTNQWRDELKYRFNMNHFEIYGSDFNIFDLTHWDKHNFVIASIDVIKNDKHLYKIQNSGYWDLIVFDEAHKLTRVRFGDQYKATERFRLAVQLRKLTNFILLLSATPHQGKHDKFIALLELIRPDLKKQLLKLNDHPEIVKDLIFRNSKSEVIDLNGNFIFKGKETFRITVMLSEKEKKFEEYLKSYLKKGYKASELSGNTYGQAIGFVMTTFRKLAASSYPAIISALDKRLKKLIENGSNTNNKMFKLFFKDETDELYNLISIAEECLYNDSKLHNFMTILENITKNNPDEKIVVFTEYKATQNYLKSKIEEIFGKDTVSLIHGSMNINDRIKAIDDFEENNRFLISTEAGGEGINLQRKCHIMINYDLPWNPMRLVQRIGRLYRYGQKKVVKVFNITTSDTIDGYLTDLLYSRIEQIVKDMSIVNNDYKPGLEAEIVGELCELVEITDILESSESLNRAKTEEDIVYTLQKAREALEKQRDILVHASSFSAKDTTEGLSLNVKHLEKFCFDMFQLLDIEITKVTHNNSVYELKLPDELKEELGFQSKNIRVSFIKDPKFIRKGILLMDINNPLLRILLEKAKAPKFGGQLAIIQEDIDGARFIKSSILRWQDEQGRRIKQEYNVWLLKDLNNVEHNSSTFSDWLLENESLNEVNKVNFEKKLIKNVIDIFNKKIEERLAALSSKNLFPESFENISAGYILNLSNKNSILK